MPVYLESFSQKKRTDYVVNENLLESQWIECSGKVIQVRPKYICSIVQYIDRSIQRHGESERLLAILDVFRLHEEEHNIVVKSRFFLRFVGVSSTRDIVLVNTCIDPKIFNKFLVHLLIMHH